MSSFQIFQNKQNYWQVTGIHIGVVYRYVYLKKQNCSKRQYSEICYWHVITCDSLPHVLNLPRGNTWVCLSWFFLFLNSLNVIIWNVTIIGTNVCEGMIKFTLTRPSSRKDHNSYKSTADIVLKTFHSK